MAEEARGVGLADYACGETARGDKIHRRGQPACLLVIVIIVSSERRLIPRRPQASILISTAFMSEVQAPCSFELDDAPCERLGFELITLL